MMNVIKANGDIEEFNEQKVLDSISRAGLPDTIKDAVLKHIKDRIYNNIPTSEVYKHISEFLGKQLPYAKAKYSLKHALMSLGPTGYPFEDYFARILDWYGYKTSVRNIMQGKCVMHEVDVVAKKGSEQIMVEAKYHNMPGTKTNVHVALYTKARFNDLIEKNNLNQAWLVTNTKVTEDAIAYALCMGMKIISWNYPEEGSLREMIEKSNLSPITSLTSLSENNKQELINNRIILAKDICNDVSCLNVLRIPKEKHSEIISEAQSITQ